LVTEDVVLLRQRPVVANGRRCFVIICFRPDGDVVVLDERVIALRVVAEGMEVDTALEVKIAATVIINLRWSSIRN